MTKERINISLDSEVAAKLRQQAFDKYHNSRSMSRLIEDLANGAVEPEEPDVCAVLGHRTDMSHVWEDIFNKHVEEITKQLNDIKLSDGSVPSTYSPDVYFAFKEACELFLNKTNELVCWSCLRIEPYPIYDTAGKNFVEWSKIDRNIR
jgi:hypothetical protein